MEIKFAIWSKMCLHACMHLPIRFGPKLYLNKINKIKTKVLVHKKEKEKEKKGIDNYIDKSVANGQIVHLRN